MGLQELDEDSPKSLFNTDGELSLFPRNPEECVEQEWQLTRQFAPTVPHTPEQAWPADVNIEHGMPVDPAMSKGLESLDDVFPQLDHAISPHQQYQQFDADISSIVGHGADTPQYGGSRLRPENVLSAQDIEVQVVKYRSSHDGNSQSTNPNLEREDSHHKQAHFSLKPAWMQQEGFEQRLRNLSPQQASAAATSPRSQAKRPQLRSVSDSTPYTEVYSPVSSQTESASTYLSPCTSRQSSAQSRKYKCDRRDCRFEFDTMGQLRKHWKSGHTPKKDWPHKCDTCGETTLEPGHLARHRREVHDQVIVGRCRKCGKADKRKWNLARHEEMCDGTKAPSTKPRRQHSSMQTSASCFVSNDGRTAERCPTEPTDHSRSSSSTSNVDSNAYECLQICIASLSSPGDTPTSTSGPARIGTSKR
jgi:hypothetical protein